MLGKERKNPVGSAWTAFEALSFSEHKGSDPHSRKIYNSFQSQEMGVIWRTLQYDGNMR